jgi:PAS domain S-box-containing protein
VLAAPLLWHGGVTGVIDVLREQPFNQADLELLTMFASQAAIAVENARALEVERATRIQVEKDITERKRAEEEIQNLAKFLSENPNPVLRITRDGTLLYINEAGSILLPGWHLQVGQASPPILREAVSRSFDRETVQSLDLEYGEKLYSFSVAPIVNAGYANLYAQDITERKRAEDALHREQEVLQRIVDNIPVMIAYLDQEGRHKWVNQCWQSTLGWSFEEAQRTNVLAEIYPDPEYLKYVVGYIATSAGSWGDFKTRAHDGRILDTSWANVLLSDGSNIGIGIDVTERKRAEEALRESEQRLSFHMENSPTAIVECDTNFIVTRWSGEAERMFGWSRAETIGKAIMDLHIIYDEDIPIVQNVMERLTDGVSRHVVSANRNYTKGGQVIYCEWYNSVLLNAQGKMVSVMSQVLDITERKRAEEALRESERKLRLIAENATDVIFAYDMDRRLIYVNPALEAFTGYTVAELEEKNFINWLYPEDEAKMLPLWEDLFAGKGFSAEEFRIVTTDGQIKWCLSSWGPLYDESGQQIGVQGRERDITERKRAEEGLRESEGRFRLLYEKAPLGYQSLDAAGCFIDVNQAWLDTLGYSREEVIGRWFGDFLAPHEVEAFKQRFAKFKATGEIKVEVKMVRKDGAHAIIVVVGRIAYDEHGGFKQTHCILTDITERKRAEEAMRESEEKYRILVERANDGIAIVQDTIIKYVNPSLAEAVGYTIGELIGTPFADYVHPDDLRKVVDRYKRRMAGEAVTPIYEIAIGRKDGSKVDVEANAGIITYQGKPAEFVIVRDLTERKQAEQALADSEIKFRWLYEYAPSAYHLLTPSGVITDVNRRWCELLGYRREEALGKAIFDFVVEGEREATKASFEKKKQSRQPYIEGSERNFRTKDGAVRTFKTHDFFVLDEAQNITSVQTTIEDLTERKQAEEALRESRARLAHLSRRLVEAQEEERRRIARELHDEVGQNLTALTISLDGVSQLALDGVMRGKIAEIQALTKHLIAEVSALSVELRPRVLDDLGLIPGLLSLFSRFSTQTGVEIDFKHTGIKRKRLAPELEISAYRIIQEALTNVVRHAGVKTASVRLQVEGDILYIQVQDEGKGFVLQQAMNAEDSMGLLSMIERAEQVGGHLTIEAAPGEGTIINCRLPLDGNHVERREYERDENRPGR